MSGKSDTSLPSEARFSLRRWSRRKLASAQAPATTPSVPATAAPGAAPVAAEAAPASAELPSVESLTPESDFAPFFRPRVDESLKRAALRQLFRDPRFNIMDGLDTYIDDYTQADPIPADMLARLAQTRYIFDPPKTELNAEGHVVDSPVDDRLAEAPPTDAAQASVATQPSAGLPGEDSTSATTSDERDG